MALEVKSASRWKDGDLAGLKAFIVVTPHCKAAILCHNGEDAVCLGQWLWALPLRLLQRWGEPGHQENYSSSHNTLGSDIAIG
jgi:hypothetical protein